MPPHSARRQRSLALRVPVVALILAFTAIPTELRRVDLDTLAEFVHFGVDVPDIIANILGFVPLGMVLVDGTRSRAIGLAAALSLFVEIMQLFSAGRSPSLIDVMTNTLGAAIGFAICRRWHIDLARVTVGIRAALAAGVLALGTYGIVAAQITPERVEKSIKLAIANPPWRTVNDRGATTPGRLEAYWTFDGTSPANVSDESGSGINAIPVNGVRFVEGVIGRAVDLNGSNQWLDAGEPTALRLVGSVTITAWINSRAFPRDDAAIVSAHSGLGYQLDTTIDTGPRTVGFKLANASGKLMARYGRTRLQLNRWYHVAGVYDAPAKTLDVYLQGHLDNGCLIGEVTGTQRVSGKHSFIGRRSSEQGFEFAGAIDEVRIYSRALTPDEIAAQVAQAAATPGLDVSSARDLSPGDPVLRNCSREEPDDTRITGLMVLFGMLVAVGTMGVWQGDGFRGAGLVISATAGALLLPHILAIVPPYFLWCVPLLTLSGGASVVASTRDETD
jgi:VanZ family protein